MAQTSTLRASADTVVSSLHPDTNYGTSEKIFLGRYSDGTYREIYVNFDLSSLPAYARVSGASLSLLQYDDENDWQTPVIQCAATLACGAWTEGGLVLNNAPGTAAGSPAAYHNVQGEDTWHAWDVTAHMQAVMNRSISWNGFRVYYTGTSNSTAKYFRSREYGTDYASLLSITWDYPFPQIQVGGSWHQISAAWMNIGGVWRHVTEIQVNVGGAWRPLG
jgi:hypothetical protein